MTNFSDKEPNNRFRFKPDFTDINGWVVLTLLIICIVFGVVYVLSYY